MEKDLKSRSTFILNCFLDSVLTIVNQLSNLHVVYFQNFSHFDGIFLINHVITDRPEYEIKPLKRNNEIDQIELRAVGKKIVFRDSLRL